MGSNPVPASIIGGFFTRFVFCILLVISLVFLLVVPCFAVDADYSITVSNTKVSSRGTTYDKSYSMSNSSPACTIEIGQYSKQTINSFSLTANVPGNYYINFFATNTTVSSVTGATDWSTADNTTSILVTVNEPGTFPITISMGYCNFDISCTSSYSAFSSTPEDPPVPPTEPTYDMNGFHGDPKTISGVGSTVWEIYNNYIGQQNTTITVNDGTMRVEAWTANLISNLAYVGWTWRWDNDKNTIVFTVPEDSRGSWADMLYRTAVWGYYWNDKLMSNDVAGSWFGSISNSFDTLNASVFRILTVLANDEDFAIKNATDDERQWVQQWYEGDASATSRFDSVNSISGNFNSVFSGVDSSIDVGTAFTSTDEGYTFWSQQCYDEIFQADASGFVSSSDSSSFSRSSPSVVDDSQIIYDAFSARWERIVNPVD